MANQPKRAFHTASEPEIKAGQVSDVYFQRTIQILKAKGLTKRVKAEIRLKSFPQADWSFGILAGIEEAAALYEKIVAAVPRPELHQALGQLYMLLERPGRARSRFVQARAGYLESVRRGGVHYDHHLADFYCEAMMDGGKAVHWARRDMALRENFSTQAALAWALLRNGEATEAPKWMDRALACGVKDAHLLAQAAAVFAAAGEDAKAARCLGQARGINPRLSRFHVHR